VKRGENQAGRSDLSHRFIPRQRRKEGEKKFIPLVCSTNVKKRGKEKKRKECCGYLPDERGVVKREASFNFSCLGEGGKGRESLTVRSWGEKGGGVGRGKLRFQISEKEKGGGGGKKRGGGSIPFSALEGKGRIAHYSTCRMLAKKRRRYTLSFLSLAWPREIGKRGRKGG